jgi:RNA polymerase sigma-70 factor (ECF subfamily)
MDGNGSQALDDAFEANRSHLGAVAYRMLGSVSDAEDAVQEAWLRASKAGITGVDNVAGWLTTIVARVCLNMLRSRASRREEPLDTHVPDPIVSLVDDSDPEREAVVADSIGFALLVVLDTLSPAERIAFVLHDVFAMPFDEIAPIVGRSPEAARQLGSRARHRLQDAVPRPDPDLHRQRAAVDAFFAATRGHDVDALLAVLDPDVVLRSDGGSRRRAASLVVQGANEVVSRAMFFAGATKLRVHPALVNGAAGVVVTSNGRPYSVMGFTVAGGRIVAIDVLADPDRLDRLDMPAFHD